MKAMWKSLDFNGNGKVSLAEIGRLCVLLGYSVGIFVDIVCMLGMCVYVEIIGLQLL